MEPATQGRTRYDACARARRMETQRPVPLDLDATLGYVLDIISAKVHLIHEQTRLCRKQSAPVIRQ